VKGDDLSLYVAAGADGLDLITGRYDLAGCLQRGDPLVVPLETEPLLRPLGSDNPARTMLAGQWRPRIGKEQWPFRLFLVSGHGQDDEMHGAVRLLDGRVVAEEDASQLYGPRGAAVVAFVNHLMANWEEVVAKLAAALAEERVPERKPMPSLAQLQTVMKQARAGERPGDLFSSAAELTTMRLGQLATSATRGNLTQVGLMFTVEFVGQTIPVGRLLGAGLSGRRKLPGALAEAAKPLAAQEVARAILAVGLRDLLAQEDADAYLQRWTEVTGVVTTG